MIVKKINKLQGKLKRKKDLLNILKRVSNI